MNSLPALPSADKAISQPLPFSHKVMVDFLKRIRRPGELVEIRLLDAVTASVPRPHTLYAFFIYGELDGLPEAIENAKTLKYKGVYYTLNPIAKTVLHDHAPAKFVPVKKGTSTGDNDVVLRAYLPIDLDPERPAKCAATNNEHAHALELGNAIVEQVSEVTDVRPFVVDSGNGCQLLYPLSDSLDPAIAEKWIKETLDVLKTLCASDAYRQYGCECDTCVSNPSRIMRLPGTWNCKGESTEERPHRQARLLSAPAEGTTGLDEKQLKDMVAHFKKQLPEVATASEQPAKVDLSCDASQRGLEPQSISPERANMSKMTCEDFMHKHCPSVSPDRNYTGSGMHGTLWAINCPLGNHDNQSACVILWDDGHVVYRCQHDHCRDYRWRDFVEKVASSPEEAKKVLENTIASNLGPVTPAADTPPAFSMPVLTQSLLDLMNTPRQPLEEVELIKQRFIERGSVCLLVAETGLGKSTLVMQFAILWAMGKPCFGLTPSGVLNTTIIQAENSAWDIKETTLGIKQGLLENGMASEEEIGEALKHVQLSPITYVGKQFVESLDYVLTQHPTDMLVIDPLYAFFGDDVSNQRAITRFLRTQLDPIVKKHNIGVIIVHHTSKSSPTKGVPNYDYNESYEAAGSAELSNYPRSILVLKRHSIIFKLMAAKHGERLRWVDFNGYSTMNKWLIHHPEYIFWQEASEDLVLRMTDASLKQARKQEKAENLQANKLAQFKEQLEKGSHYTQSELVNILVGKQIETSTRKQYAFISRAVSEGILEQVTLTPVQKRRYKIAGNAKKIYKLRE